MSGEAQRQGPFNPCVSCGACCAFFRASFYFGETDEHTPGGVPAELTVPITPWRVAMKGTERVPPRCTALEGEIAQSVRCTIYERRSSICREVMPSYHDGVTVSEQCDKARRAHGLPLLTPGDWTGDPGEPEPDPILPDAV